MTTVLALDLSTHCGWTHDRPSGGMPFFGTEHLPSVEFDGEGTPIFGPTFAAFWKFLDGKVSVVQPGHIAYEAPLPNLKPRNGKTTPVWVVRLQLGLSALTETYADLRGISCSEEHVATVRKYFVDDGRAQKPDVMRRCRLLGWHVRNDNEGDSCALWAYTKAVLDPQFSYRTTPMFGRAGT